MSLITYVINISNCVYRCNEMHLARGNLNDKAWINNNMDYLIENYLGKYIAVLNNSVIETANSREELEQKIQERKLPLFLTVVKKIDIGFKRSLLAKLTVFVEGPTDVCYIKKAAEILEKKELFKAITIDNIGDKTGSECGGYKNLGHCFNFFKNNPELRPNKVLFLFDQDVKDRDFPNGGKDFENLFIRRIDDFSTDKKGIEYLFSDKIFEEGFEKGFVQKDLGRATFDEPTPKPIYIIKNKKDFCNWICIEHTKNSEDFIGFHKIFQIIDSIISL